MSLFLPSFEVDAEPDDSVEATSIESSLKGRNVVHHMTNAGFHFLKFVYVLVDSKPFFAQYNRIH